MITKGEVLAKLLPLDTEVVKDDDNFRATTISDVIDDNERPNDMGKYYIADSQEMPKPDVAGWVIDMVGEHMDENCSEWLDRNEEELEPLKAAIQVVFDKWREGLGTSKTVYKMETRVVFEHELKSDK